MNPAKRFHLFADIGTNAQYLDPLAEKQRELQESNKELSERNGILELQIKAKEATLRDIDAAAKAMFAPPEQPVATDMAGFEGDEV